MAVGTIKFKITADAKELKQAMAEASQAVKQTSGSVKSSGGIFSGIGKGIKGIGSAIGGTISKLGKMAASMTVFKAINATMGMIGNSVQSAFNRMDTMYAFEKAMTRITGSTKEAQKAIDATNQVVKGTPYGLDTAAKAVQGFANSNIGIKDSVKYVESWADAVAAYGDGSDATLQNVTFQLQQMTAKGTANLGDLKSAMEAGIPVLQIYADATGQSLSEVRDQISNAEISSEDFMQTLDEAFRNGTANFKGIAGAAKDMGATWQGTFSNMKMATTRGVIAIIDAIDAGLQENGLMSIKEALGAWGSALETGLTEMASKVTPAMSTVIGVIQGAWPTIQSVFNAVKDIAVTTAEKLGSAFMTVGPEVGDTFASMAEWITTHMDTIESIISTVIDIATGVFLGFTDTIKEIGPHLIEFVDWVTKVGSAISDMLPEGTTLTDVVRELTPPILKAILAFKMMNIAVGAGKGVFKGFNGILKAMDGFNNFRSALKGTARGLANISPGAKVAVKVIKMVGSAGKLMGTLIKAAVGVAGKAFGALASVVMAHPVIAAIAAIIAVIVLLWNKCEWFRDGVKAIWSVISDSFKSGVDRCKDALSTLGDWIGNMWSGIKDAFNSGKEHLSNAWNSIKEGVSSAKDSFVEGFNAMVDVVSTVMETIWNVIQVVFMAIGSFIEGIFTFIGSIVLAGFNIIKYLFQVSLAWLSEKWSAAWTFIKDLLSPILDAISNSISAAWDWIKEKTSAVWDGIKLIFTMVWEGIKAVVSPAVEWIKEAVSTAWDWIKITTSAIWDGIKMIFTIVWDVIKGIFTAAVDGIKIIVSTAWNIIKAVTSTVWNGIKKVTSTIWNGIKNVVTTAANALKTAVTTAWNAIKAVTSTVWNGIKSVTSSIWNGIKSKVSSIATGIKSNVSKAWNGVKSLSSSVWSAVKNDMVTKMDNAKNRVKSAIDAVKGFFSRLHLRFPKIEMPALPHFSLSGKFSIKPPSVPKLSVNWYETGGIATGSSVVGIGENGDEAIVPLSNKSRMQPFAKAVSDMLNKDNNDNDNGAFGNNSSRRVILEVPVYLDGKQFARATVHDLETEMKRRERYANRRDGVK